MRASTRLAIKEAVDAVVAPMIATLGLHVIEQVTETRDAALTAIAKVQPAAVDMTQEMADDIVRKIHGPLTISKEFSAWVAEQGKFSDCYYQFQIGYGSDAGRGDMRLKGDGTMHLTLSDRNGARLWMGTFVPADFGVADK